MSDGLDFENEKSILLLAISKLPLSPNQKIGVFKNINNINDFKTNFPHNIENLISKGKNNRYLHSIDINRLLNSCFSELGFIKGINISIVSYYDKNYPNNLKNIPDPPFVLFFRGNFIDNNKKIISIVGTRKPTTSGLQTAYDLGVECSELGYQVISGFAHGVDIQSQKGCFLEGGATFGILGTPYDTIYPAGNSAYITNIIRNGGGIISEYSRETKTQGYYFLERNRLIAGICDAIILVQSPYKSGANNTITTALATKDVYVHKVGLEMEGSKNFVSQGATLIESISDIKFEY